MSRYPGVVVENRSWRNKVTGATASLYGSLPYTNDSDQPNWELVTNGYTISWSDGTVGMPTRQPFKTREEAEQYLRELPGRLSPSESLHRTLSSHKNLLAYKSIVEIKRANADAGLQFFSPKSLREHGIKVLPKVYGGSYFIISQPSQHGKSRSFSIYVARRSGGVGRVVPEDQFAFPTKAAAEKYITTKLLNDVSESHKQDEPGRVKFDKFLMGTPAESEARHMVELMKRDGLHPSLLTGTPKWGEIWVPKNELVAARKWRKEYAKAILKRARESRGNLVDAAKASGKLIVSHVGDQSKRAHASVKGRDRYNFVGYWDDGHGWQSEFTDDLERWLERVKARGGTAQYGTEARKAIHWAVDLASDYDGRPAPPARSVIHDISVPWFTGVTEGFGEPKLSKVRNLLGAKDRQTKGIPEPTEIKVGDIVFTPRMSHPAAHKALEVTSVTDDGYNIRARVMKKLPGEEALLDEYSFALGDLRKRGSR